MRRTASTQRVLSVLVGLGLIVAAAAGYRFSDPQADFAVVRGQFEEPHRFNQGTAKVDDLRIGSRLDEGDATVTTEGLFLAVRISVQAPKKVEVHVQNVQLLAADGTVYEPFDSGEQVFADPGFETIGDVVFEVSPDRIDDLTVQLWDSTIVDGYHQRLRVHLGITGDNAAQWVQAAQGQVVEATGDDTSVGLP